MSVSDVVIVQAKAEMAKKKRRRPPAQTESQMDIVFVSAEAAPWSKTGGLGDVIGSLPIALAERGHRVMVVVPRYSHHPPSGQAGHSIVGIVGPS